MAFHVPDVSMATGQKMCVDCRLQYLSVFCCAAWLAAAPGVIIIIIIVIIIIHKLC